MTSPGVVTLPAATTWTPSHGGHECLVAAVYDEQAIGGLATSTLLDGDAPWTSTYSVAQHNLGVLATGVMKRMIQYPFQVCNGADDEREFVVTAWQAPLKQIANFLPEHAGPANRLGETRQG